jgi:hypothetical protein
MAARIRDAYQKLAGNEETPEPKAAALTLEQLIQAHEGTTIEFKSTLRTNLHTGEKDGC